MRIDLESRCRACSQITKIVPSRKFYSKAALQEYSLYHCKKCDLMFWQPLKVIPELYEDEAFGYFEQHYQLNIELSSACRIFFEKMPLKNGLLLDVGGSCGLFALEAQKRGFEVYLIDFDKKSVEAARKNGIDKAFTLSLEDFVGYSKEKDILFDVITFFEVLEHQDNIDLFIKSIKEILKPCGFIAGSVPNRERPLANLLRCMDGQDLPPHHFFWWNERSLKYFFHLHNFTFKLFPTKVSLFDATAHLIDLLMGQYIREIKKMILRHKKEKTQTVKTKRISSAQRIGLLAMKYLRHFCLLPFGFFLKILYDIKGGVSFYFQGQLIKK